MNLGPPALPPPSAYRNGKLIITGSMACSGFINITKEEDKLQRYNYLKNELVMLENELFNLENELFNEGVLPNDDFTLTGGL